MASTPPTTVLPRPPVLALLLPILVALLAYAESLDGGWIFDDLAVFVEGSAMAKGHWWSVAFGTAHTPLANRPFTCWTFAVNPTVAGSVVMGLRVGNLLLHVANALLLLGVVRRCLLAPNLSGRFTAARATWLATAVATLWACHPLGVDAVAYVTQRTTLLMSCCFLVALYATLRRWRAVVVVALALGMASKEELVAAPLLIVLFERVFLLPDWHALRNEARYYAALAATWLVLAVCVALGPSNMTVGFAAVQKVTAFQWLMTQASVILHYLRLVVWPQGLRGVYDWGIVRDLGSALLPLLAVAALFVAVMWQWRTRPWLAWLGTMFFLLLGPTSSLMPIVTEVAAERRMYLPMLAVLVPLVLAVEALLRRHAGAVRLPVVAGVALAVVTVPFVLAARAHAALFHDQKVFWTVAYEQNDLTSGSMVSAIILGAYANVLHDQGKLQEAIAMVERGMKCEAKMERVPLTYGEFLREAGRLDESEAVLRELLRTRPDVGPAHGVLAFILVTRHEAALVQGLADPSDPRLAEAVQLAQRAYELDAQPAFLNTLGMALTRQGKVVEAERVLRDTLREEPDFLDAKKSLAALLCFTNRMPEGLVMLREVAAGKPKDTKLRLSIVQGYLQIGDTASAILMLREVLRIEPGRQDAQQLLLQLESAPR